jgi:hypothetical protein
MNAPDTWKSNAFRVLDLSTSAKLLEIHKAASNLKRMASLGGANSEQADLASLGLIDRTESSLRAAVGRLENPLQRLHERLFWFHFPPTTGKAGKSSSSAAPQGVAQSHDAALHQLFAALQVDADDAGMLAWGRALKAWQQITSYDDYWEFSLGLEEEGAFEPPALRSDIAEVRSSALALAAEPLLMGARNALVKGDSATVQKILTTIDGFADSGSWVSAAYSEFTSSAVEHLHTVCKSLYKNQSALIERVKDAGERNKSRCSNELKYFRQEVLLALSKLQQLVRHEHEVAQQAREEAANCLGQIASDHTWADDYVAAEDLNKEALELAKGTISAIRLQAAVDGVHLAAHRQRIYGKPVSSAPGLRTVNGIGTTLYGSSDYDRETDSYIATYYFVFFAIPLFPITRYRVTNNGSRTYSFLGEHPLRVGDRWHLGIVIGSIVALIIAANWDSSGNKPSTQAGTSSSRAPSAQAAQTSYSSPPPSRATQAQVTTEALTNYTSNSVDASATPPTSAPAYDASRYRDAQLNDLKLRIDTGRARLAVLKNYLAPIYDQLRSLQSQMKSIDGELQTLDAQQKAGYEIDIDAYNVNVRTYNSLLEKYRHLKSDNDAYIEEEDHLLKVDSDLVNRYNVLLN